ncbi:MAG: aldo/keto reductase [Chlorobiaceae bacterium]|nr:aldo/keto reductase [Chlorobiaceae bacterium]
MRLALGTVQFGLSYGIANKTGQVTREEAGAMLDLAANSGIDTLDTAIAYGESEVCLGQAGVERFRIVTKLPAVPKDCTDVCSWVSRQLNGSLMRLGVSEVYGLMLHRPEQLLSSYGKALYSGLTELKDRGLVQKIGISVYSPDELEHFVDGFAFDLVQAPFNLVDRRLFSSGWMRLLKDAGFEIHVRSAFLQGLLLMSRTDRPSKFAPWSSLWDRWDEWIAGSAVTPLQACLAFVLGFEEVDRVVVGTDGFRQLLEIIDASRTGGLIDRPDIGCDDERLVNPSKWAEL